MSGPRIVAIHQPNFFPWLGFFHKMAQVDALILMDNAQLPRTSRGSWVNRVRLLVGGEPRWVTMPVRRPHGDLMRIADVQIENSQPWRTRFVRSLEVNYAQAGHFDVVLPLLRPLIEHPDNQVTLYNANAIRRIAALLSINTEVVHGSSLPTKGRATDLLISMVRAVGAKTYVCGAGALGYQEDEKFALCDIALRHQQFEHPAYRQTGRTGFVAGLSIIDALLNCGVQATRGFILGGRPEER